MRKNTSSQIVCAQLVSKTDGSAVTGGSTVVYYLIDGGTQGTGAGTITHEGNGTWSYAPVQSETNGDHVAWTFANSSAVSVCVNTYPVSIDPTDAVRMGMTALPNAAADAAGGLPVSDAGGLDLDTHIGGLTFTVSNQVDANVLGVSGSTNAADKLEYIYDTHYATMWDDTNKQFNVTITGTPDVNAVQISGSTTAANNVEQVFHTDFATAYDTTNDKWSVLADVTKISGSTTAADNAEIVFDTDFATNYSTTNDKWQVEADMTKISGDATAADRLEESANGAIPFTVQTGTLSTTQCSTNLAEGTDEHYTNSSVIFLTGALAGQRRKITAYTGTGGILTYAAMTEAPSNGDTGVIV